MIEDGLATSFKTGISDDPEELQQRESVKRYL